MVTDLTKLAKVSQNSFGIDNKKIALQKLALLNLLKLKKMCSWSEQSFWGTPRQAMMFPTRMSAMVVAY